MFEKLKIYLILIEFPVFVIDTLRIFLCVFSISVLNQEDGQKVTNFSQQRTKNYSICANYLLLLIDCVLFYFIIRFNKITLILMLRIAYLLLSVSLIMVLINNRTIDQQVASTQNCCLNIDLNKDRLMQVSSTNRAIVVQRPNNERNNENQTSSRRRIKKKKVLIKSSNRNCSIVTPNEMLNQITSSPLNISSFGLNSNFTWLDDYHFTVQQYFRITEITLIILSMIVYSLSIFTIDIYFFQIPYT